MKRLSPPRTDPAQWSAEERRRRVLGEHDREHMEFMRLFSYERAALDDPDDARARRRRRQEGGR